ncbi:protein of unknown function [Legionella pneumophila subsp. pneumophila]|uniref:Uncharacterized protein n=1 Tax=Legionella pneumophila subsp. pneumophila TaxID=91891 RepID=A0AAV2UZU2_LEGPN|nr:protein of unknown function [Legionella pneumophila subsp. pneumophila]
MSEMFYFNKIIFERILSTLELNLLKHKEVQAKDIKKHRKPEIPCQHLGEEKKKELIEIYN